MFLVCFSTPFATGFTDTTINCDMSRTKAKRLWPTSATTLKVRGKPQMNQLMEQLPGWKHNKWKFTYQSLCTSFFILRRKAHGDHMYHLLSHSKTVCCPHSVFRKILTTNSDYFPIQHYNRSVFVVGTQCSLRGGNSVFIKNSSFTDSEAYSGFFTRNTQR
jgi:hypothetical protein